MFLCKNILAIFNLGRIIYICMPQPYIVHALAQLSLVLVEFTCQHLVQFPHKFCAIFPFFSCIHANIT